MRHDYSLNHYLSQNNPDRKDLRKKSCGIKKHILKIGKSRVLPINESFDSDINLTKQKNLLERCNSDFCWVPWVGIPALDYIIIRNGGGVEEHLVCDRDGNNVFIPFKVYKQLRRDNKTILLAKLNKEELLSNNHFVMPIDKHNHKKFIQFYDGESLDSVYQDTFKMNRKKRIVKKKKLVSVLECPIPIGIRY